MRFHRTTPFREIRVTSCMAALYTAKTVVLNKINRGPHHAFYTGVKFAVLV